jgi:hypothetical protein
MKFAVISPVPMKTRLAAAAVALERSVMKVWLDHKEN